MNFPASLKSIISVLTTFKEPVEMISYLYSIRWERIGGGSESVVFWDNKNDFVIKIKRTPHNSYLGTEYSLLSILCFDEDFCAETFAFPTEGVPTIIIQEKLEPCNNYILAGDYENRNRIKGFGDIDVGMYNIGIKNGKAYSIDWCFSSGIDLHKKFLTSLPKPEKLCA